MTTPTRRTFLSGLAAIPSAAIATVSEPLQGTATAKPSVAEHRDAELFKLIDYFNEAEAELDRLGAIKERHFEAYIDRKIKNKNQNRSTRRSSAHVAAERQHSEALKRANNLLDQFAAMPARTVAHAGRTLAEDVRSGDLAARRLADMRALMRR
jgi:hypothetical protein